MNRWQWLEVILAITIISGGLAWLAVMKAHEGALAASAGSAPTEASSPAPPSQGKHGSGRYAQSGPMPVSTVPVRKGNIDITVNALGTVTPLATVTVVAQISGQLTQINFTEGQLVKAGDFLAQIDPRPYQLALEQAQGALTRDQALLHDAQIDLARYTKLVAQDSLARQQLDTQKALVLQYQGAVQTDQGLIDASKLNIDYCHITAPLTGRVGLRQVDQGNYVQLSSANGIVVITQTQPTSVIFSPPEDNLPAIMKRMNSGAVLPVTAYDRSQSIKLAEGKLISVDNQIDTTTGTIKMRAQFDNTDGALFANQFVNIQLLVDTIKDATVIPSAAVRTGTPGTFVYVLKPGNVVAMTPIKLGPAEGENVSVLSGLSVGDVIVSDGADKLKDGAVVSVPDADAAAVPADTADHKKDGAMDDAKEHHHHHKTDTAPDSAPPAGK